MVRFDSNLLLDAEAGSFNALFYPARGNRVLSRKLFGRLTPQVFSI